MWNNNWVLGSALLLSCGSFLIDLPSGVAGSVENINESSGRCAEQSFVGKRLEKKIFAGVLEWQLDEGKGRWKDPEITTPLRANAQLILVHFWAHWCEPCKRDFKVYKSVAQYLPLDLRKKYGAEAPRNAVQFLYLAEDTPTNAMQDFLTNNPDLLTGGDNYQDTAGRVMRDLQQKLGCTISLPLTLLLDRDQRIRAAFSGSIESRRATLSEELERLAEPPAKKGRDTVNDTPIGSTQ